MNRRDDATGSDGALIFAGLGGLALLAAVYACGGSDAATTGSATGDAGTTAEGGSTSDGGSTGIAPACTSDPATAANRAAVVAAASTLAAALTDAQRTAIQYDKTLQNAQQWSNFPAGVVKRNGVKLGDLSAGAQAAADALIDAAAGSAGASMFSEIRGADEAFASSSNDPTLFGRANYYVSFHGTPSTASPWMLQLAGHHVAYNITYGGTCTSATPLFDGVQPSTWTDSTGQSHAPLEPQRAAFGALLASVGSVALLTGTYTDMLNGPSALQGGSGGGNDSKYFAGLTYPTGTTGRGASVGALSAAQKTLVKTVIEAWVKNVADPVSAALLAAYESDDVLAQTYVGYSGSTDLSTSNSYARIDGPRIWIEFTVQEGTATTPQGHYHSVWRDKVSDYGADYASQ